MADSVMDAFYQAPPISRTVAATTFVTSLGIHFGVLPYQYFIFHPFYIFKFPPEPWRFVTSFLITGSGLSLLFDTYFLYQYLSQLEVGNPRFSRKEDLIWYLTFVSGTILFVNYLSGLEFMTFLRALILAMVYTVTQSQRGMKASFYFVTIPAQLTPYAMMAINLLLPGGPMTILLQLQGLVAAHLFEFCTRIWPQTGGSGRSLLPTPPFLTRLVNRFTGQGAAGPRRPGEAASSGSSTGRSTGPLPDSWRTRGTGHRLG